jgi:hypothetical protein
MDDGKSTKILILMRLEVRRWESMKMFEKLGIITSYMMS